MTICRSIHGTAKALFHSILWLSNIPLYIYVPHLLYSSVNGHLGCFRASAIVNSAAMKRPWCWKRLRTGGEGDDRGWDGLGGIIDSMGMSLSKLWGIVKNGEAWQAAVHWVAKSQVQLSNWTATWTSGEQQAFLEFGIPSHPSKHVHSLCDAVLLLLFGGPAACPSGRLHLSLPHHVSLSKMPFYFYTLWNLLNIIINETFFPRRKLFKIIWTHEIKSKLDSK